MTHSQMVMVEALVRQNYCESTRECHIRAVKEFVLYFNRPPDKLDLEPIRIVQVHPFSNRKLSPNTLNRRLAAVRVFFVKTLHQPWNTAETPYPKRVNSLPKALSPEEVGVLIESAIIPFHCVILMARYDTGVRRRIGMVAS
jgi:integrase/recombinase XerD